MKSKIFVMTFSILAGSVLGQNPKKYVKNGKNLLESQQYTSALVQFNEAIKLDSTYTDAYIYRADIYEKTNQLPKAAEDYMTAARQQPKKIDYLYEAGRLNYLISNYDTAHYFLTRALELDNTNFQVLQYEALTYTKLGEYKNAIEASNRALQISSSYLCYDARAVAYDSLQNFTDAIENYYKTMGLNPDFSPAYFALARAYLKNKQPREALEIANQAVERFKDIPQAYFTRSYINHELGNLMNAINDLSKLLVMVEDNNEILLLQGRYYFESGQYQNAVSDFSRILDRTDAYPVAFYWRGRAYQEMMENESASDDFVRFLAKVDNQEEESSLIADARQQVYQLNRETNPPLIKIGTPMVFNHSKLGILKNSEQVFLSGQVIDQSNLASFLVNGKPVLLSPQHSFRYRLNLSGLDSVSFSATDIYGNQTTNTYGLERIETTPPKIVINTPYADDDHQIYLDSPDQNLLIEGHIEDESLITEILIDGKPVDFNKEELNPEFSATLLVSNKDSLTITATDQFQNTNQITVKINRQNFSGDEANPMGKTWWIYIENTGDSLQQEHTNEVDSLRKACSAYAIHAFIHKKNMTKAAMTTFFSNTLDEWIKKNAINSLVITFKGAGKQINQSTYWLPSDASESNEATWFSLDLLLVDLKDYSPYLTHLLLISDGSLFPVNSFQAETKSILPISCEQPVEAGLKSAQVVALNSEPQSDFTRALIQGLDSTVSPCITINSLIKQANRELKNIPKIQFGWLKGFEHEKGTFVFIRK